MSEQIKPRHKLDWRWLAGLMAAGAVVGYTVGGYLASNRIALWGGEPQWSVLAALFVALIMAVTAVLVLAGLIKPSVGSRFLNVEDAEELIEQRALLVASGLGIVAMAAILVLLAFADSVGGPLPAAVVALACALLAVVLVVAARRQHGLSDELMRETSRDAGNHAFTVMAGLGGIWAIAAHLGYLSAPQPLDWLTVAAVATLAGAIVAAGKRGLLKQR
jgi:MFS family permease